MLAFRRWSRDRMVLVPWPHAGMWRIGFVTDTACDLPDSVVFENGIGLVPTQLIVGERVYRDRLELTAAEFIARLRLGVDASTSQPTPQEFRDAFRDATGGAEHVVCVALARSLSGTFANAEAAAREVDGGRITVLDSRSASLGEGLLVLRGIELAAAGGSPESIVAELRRVRDQSGGFFTVTSFDRLVRSGRVSRVQAWLGRRLNVKPIMAIDPDGRIEPIARARGATVRARLLERLDRALQPRPRELRLGVAHCDIPEFAEQLRGELMDRYRPKQCLVSPITPVIATHAGIGAWGVFYQIEDAPRAAGTKP